MSAPRWAPSRRLVRAALASVGLALTLALAARADAAPTLEVTGAPTAAEVPLGGDIEVLVTVKNVGADAPSLPELTFDARSVSFEVSFEGGRTAWDTQFHISEPTPAQYETTLVALKRSPLKAGESWKATYKIPALAAGAWSITAVYAGTSPDNNVLAGIDEPSRLVKLKSQPAAVKVLPGPGGETEVAANVATTLGSIRFRFFPKDALGSAINFVRLARSGFYEGKSFHRIDSSLGVVQGGATAADGGGFFAYSIPRELGLKHRTLRVGMARSRDPNSAGSQFYICTSDSTATLDVPDGYAIFAEVTRGKDVVESLAAVKTRGGQGQDAQQPSTPLKIESVKTQLVK